MKKQYWRVDTYVYDDGRMEVEMRVGAVPCSHKPSGTFTEEKAYDYYRDWFDTKAEAQAFVNEAVAVEHATVI